MQQFHDWMLALAVLVLVIIDVVIIGGYLAVERIRDQLVVDKVPNRENHEDVIGVSWSTCTLTKDAIGGVTRGGSIS